MGAERRLGAVEGDALSVFVGAFVDELARSGVGDLCLCPGSRSTPLALLAMEHPAIRVWTHLDERSAAFFALGIAKARRAPVALLCTSGTAAVNFGPAVVEARYAHVPLIVLTADRPPELRDAGALQTIDQTRLYGSHAKWFAEAMLPEANADAVRYARTLAARGVATARAGIAGPVHLNFPFREPLIPSGRGPVSGEGAPPWVSVAQPPASPDPSALAGLASWLGDTREGLIVCGPQDDPALPDAAAALAEALGYPLLADPLSGVRCGRRSDTIIDSYDAFLRDERLAAGLKPQVVLRFGAPPVSKPLMLYLQRHAGARQIVVEQAGGWSDFAFVASDVINGDPAAICRALLAATASGASRRSGDGASTWLRRWRRIGSKARATLTGRIEAAELSEPGVFAELAALLPEGAALFAGNSMPVRDLDSFFPGGGRRVRFLANRGASGIDGVVSTALGASSAVEGPLVLVIGDLSLYHDMNGLLAAGRHGLSATIVLINNDGGGIFSLLPQAEQADHFEELFGTPHGLDFRHAARMYGLDYRRAESRAGFRAAVVKSLDSPGVTLIEVRTERAANARLHSELFGAVSDALAATEGRGVAG